MPTSCVTFVEGHQHALKREQTGERVAHGEAHAGWWLIREAVQVAKAARCFTRRRVAGTVRVRALLSVARDASDDEARVALHEHIGAHTPTLERAGLEVLHEHIAFVEQSESQLLPFRLSKIERDDLLVASEERPPQGTRSVRSVGPNSAPVTHRVALIGGFNLDDLSPEVAQHAPDEGTGEDHPKFEHPEPTEPVQFVVSGQVAHQSPDHFTST